jgi:hypothetical protein
MVSALNSKKIKSSPAGPFERSRLDFNSSQNKVPAERLKRDGKWGRCIFKQLSQPDS